MATAAVAAASRLTGTAPCGIVFDATGSTHDSTARPFEECAYRWDFGDESADAIATEAVAVHVYKTPGTYTAKLYMTYDGVIILTDELTITIADPATVYSGTNTICFSNDDDFTGKPTGAAEVTTSLFADVISALSAGKRALLKRGDTFSQTAASTPGALAAINCQIGAFGTPGGAADAFGSYDDDPLIDLEAGTGNWPCTLSCNNCHQLSVWNLRFRMENTGDAPAFVGRTYESENENLTFTSIRVIAGTGGENPHTVFTFPADGSKLHEGMVFDRINCLSLKAYGVYIGGYKVGISNCYFDDIEYQHHVRFPHVKVGVIQNNSFMASAAGTHNIKLCSPTWDGTNYSEYVVITGNTFDPNGASYSVQLSSENSGLDQRPRHIIVSKNHWYCHRAYLFIAIYCHGYDYEIRFNRIYETAGVTGSNYMTFLCLIAKEPASKPESYGFRFIGNCIYGLRTHASGNGYLCQNTAGYAGEIIYWNNVCYNPNESSTYALYNDTQAETITQAGNLVTKVSDPLWTAPLTNDWTIPTGSPCKNAGSDDCTFPFDAAHKLPAGVRDQGAYDFGGTEPAWPTGTVELTPTGLTPDSGNHEEEVTVTISLTDPPELEDFLVKIEGGDSILGSIDGGIWTFTMPTSEDLGTVSVAISGDDGASWHTVPGGYTYTGEVPELPETPVVTTVPIASLPEWPKVFASLDELVAAVNAAVAVLATHVAAMAVLAQFTATTGAPPATGSVGQLHVNKTAATVHVCKDGENWAQIEEVS